jgi:hypothetical protein
MQLDVASGTRLVHFTGQGRQLSWFLTSNIRKCINKNQFKVMMVLIMITLKITSLNKILFFEKEKQGIKFVSKNQSSWEVKTIA